jgi:hypothetical protein
LAAQEESKESIQPVSSSATSSAIDRRVNRANSKGEETSESNKKANRQEGSTNLLECVEMNEITVAVEEATEDSLPSAVKNQQKNHSRFPLLRNVPFVHFLSNSKQAFSVNAKSKLKYALKNKASTKANESMLDQNGQIPQQVQKRHLKSMSICSYERFKATSTSAAPLARPESYSDIMSDMENSNYIIVSTGNRKTRERSSLTLLDSKAATTLTNNSNFLNDAKKYANDQDEGDNNEMDYAEPFDANENENNMIYYDESINFKNSLFELQQNKVKPSDDKAYSRSGMLAKANDDRLDNEEYELKSSVIWWPYQESNSNIDSVANAHSANGNIRQDLLETGSDECLAQLAEKKKTAQRRHELMGIGVTSEYENPLDCRGNCDDDDEEDNELNAYEISLNNSTEMNHNELIENRIATSTPRADSSAVLGEHQTNCSNNLGSNEANESPSPLEVKKRLNYFRPQRSPNLKPPDYNQATRRKQRPDIEKNSFDEKTYISSVTGSGANEINSLLKLSTTSSSSSASSPNTASPPLNTTGSVLNDNRSTSTENSILKRKSNKYSFSSGTFTTATERTDPSSSSGGKNTNEIIENATVKNNANNKSVNSSNGSSNQLNYDTSIDKSSNLFAASNMTSENDNGDTSSSFSLNNSNLNAANSSASNGNIPGERYEGNGGQSGSCIVGENKLDNDNLKSNRNDESTNTNYTSIEKLEIIKPQSKDYILCFDTSSLDHSSNQSIASGDYNQASNFKGTDKLLGVASATTTNNAASNLSISQTIPNEKDILNASIGAGGNHHLNIKSNNSASVGCINIKLNDNDFYDYENEQQLIRRHRDDHQSENKTQNTRVSGNIDYPDSGIDTARTLSPHLFTSCAFSIPSDDSDKIRQQLFSSSSAASSIITSSLTNNNSSSAIITSTSSSAATSNSLNPNMIASVSSEYSANLNTENSKNSIISSKNEISNNENNNYLNDSLEQDTTQSK